MPVEFLSDDQAAAYGRYIGPPTQEQLERFFFLDDADQARVGRRRREATALGFAIQLGTVRFLGTFLDDPVDVPWAVVAFVAGQLGIGDSSCVNGYGARPMTAYQHQWDIRRDYGYGDFTERASELRSFVEARAWLSNEGPRALFDRATAWCVEHKVLLPGVTTMARMISEVRAAATERLWSSMGRTEDTTGIVPFGRLVEQVMTVEPYASAKRVFWIVDNGSSHRGQASIDRLEGQWPTLRLIHLPVHASWLDQCEIYFSIVQRKVVNPNDFTDLDQITERLAAFENRYNATAEPFDWTFGRDDLDKLLARIDAHEQAA